MEAKKLKRFGIYYPKDGVLNIGCDLEKHEYEYVTSVESETLIRVFYKAQNDLNPEYAKLGKRSILPGDIIVDDVKVFMLLSKGMKRIPKTKPLYTKIMETDEAIIERLSHAKLTEEDLNDLIENSF